MENNEQSHLKGILEALLFIAEKPLDLATMQEVVEGIDGETVKKLMEELKTETSDFDNAWKTILQEYLPLISNFSPLFKYTLKSRCRSIEIKAKPTISQPRDAGIYTSRFQFVVKIGKKGSNCMLTLKAINREFNHIVAQLNSSLNAIDKMAMD